MNTTCYLCGGADLTPVPGAVRDDPSLRVLCCASCGLVFLSSFDHISDGFYRDSGMHADAIDVAAWLRETAPDDDRRAAAFSAAVTGRSVLDFGCGAGGFLARIAPRASRAVGVEVEARLRSHFAAAGLTVHPDLDAVPGTFDVITLFHVLEHFPDPVGLLTRLAGRLAPGGRIIVEVPNPDDALLTLYRSEAFARFTYWSCHLFLFTEKTLTAVTERAGLRPLSLTQIQRYPLSNHLYWLSQGKPGGHKAWAFLDSPELTDAYARSLAVQKRCDTVVGIFSLPENL